MKLKWNFGFNCMLLLENLKIYSKQKFDNNYFDLWNEHEHLKIMSMYWCTDYNYVQYSKFYKIIKWNFFHVDAMS